MNLFNLRILRERIARFDFPTEEEAVRIGKRIANWQYSLREGSLAKTKEKSIQGSFIVDFFKEILGYTSQFDGKNDWNLIQHPKSEVDAQEPDGSLGFFTNNEKLTKAIIELKDAKTLLDKKQTGREKGYTSIEQAYLYSTKFDRCNWIIVSNFREIRLYHKSRSEHFFEKFDVLELHKPEEFKRFYYLLCKQNLISRTSPSTIDDLANESTREDEAITNTFYQDYKNLRVNLYHELSEQNRLVERTLLLENAQKIIDRIIFILFCEDTGGLLPRNLVKDTYSIGIRSRERSDQKVWREFKNLFIDIDLGRTDIDPKINQYNGGLFAPDDVLDNLMINDATWERIVSLDKYNFENELNVNILGHIFEQSISDIEDFKATLWGKEARDDISKRKIGGIFYTPEFITKYLIETVVGRFLEEHPDKLESITILDPACGSGAFLNQAHTYLMNEYTIRTERKLLEKTEAGIQQLDLSDVNLTVSDRSILLNNLFGVDLNSESVEITKLSLWLKTAHKSEPLQNLDKNIKCGNSIVDDPAFAGARAFKWENEFKQILDDGGFDVIVGNPPYVRQELIKDIKPYLEKTYQVYTGISDLYVYFFEKAMSLLKENGYFAFIVSNKFLRAVYGQKLTQYLQKNFTILSLIDFGGLQIFEGAITYPCIITMQKKRPSATQRVPFLKLTSLERVAELGLELKEYGETIEIHSDDTSWQLRTLEENHLLEKLTRDNTPLGNIVPKEIFRGIMTGFNEGFLVDTATRDRLYKSNPGCEEFLKTILEGEDIDRYDYTSKSLWSIVIPAGWTNKNRQGIDAETFIQSKYPAIYSHLQAAQAAFTKKGTKKNRKGLYARDDQGDYWWELRPCVYYQSFESPKIIWGNLATQASFAYDEEGYYINNPACFIPTREKWLLAILNSSVTTFFLKNTAIERQGGFFEQKPVYIKQIPIPNVTNGLREVLTEKVDMLLKLHIEKQQLYNQALDVLISQYRTIKFSYKLKTFLRLGWNELIEELEKQKVKLDLAQKDNLNTWFRGKQKAAANIYGEIEKLEKEVDLLVYNLYGLNANEIKLIERNNTNAAIDNGEQLLSA